MNSRVKFGILLILLSTFFAVNYYKNVNYDPLVDDYTNDLKVVAHNQVPTNIDYEPKWKIEPKSLVKLEVFEDTPPVIALHFEPSDNDHSVSDTVLRLINLIGLQDESLQLIDRSSVSDLLTEQVIQSGFSGQNFTGLALADFSLSVEIVNIAASQYVLFRLLRNDSAEILSLDLIEYSENLAADIKAVLSKISVASRQKKIVPNYSIGLGHIFNQQEHTRGASIFLQHQIGQNLLSTKAQGVALVSRVSMLPLIFENYLRQLQQGGIGSKKSADLLISGHFFNTDENSASGAAVFSDDFKTERKAILTYFDASDQNAITAAATLISQGIESFYIPVLKIQQGLPVEGSSVALTLSAVSGLTFAGLNAENITNRKIPSASVITLKPETVIENAAEAIQMLSRAIKLDGSNLHAYLLLFQLQVTKGNYIQAEKTRTNFNWYFNDDIHSTKLAAQLLYNHQQPLKFSNLKERDIYPSFLVRVKRDKRLKADALYYENLPENKTIQETLNFIASAELARHIQYKPNVLAIPEAFQTRKHVRLPPLVNLPYGAEVNLHLGRAMQRSGLYLHLYGDKFGPLIEPTIDSYLTAANHDLDTKSIIDSFASAYFLDKNKLEALFYLGYTLCTTSGHACKWGKLYHAWVSENLAPEQLFPFGGLTVEQVLRRNQMNTVLFHSALSVGQLHTARFSPSVKKNLYKQFNGWLEEAARSQVESSRHLIVYCNILNTKPSQTEKTKVLKNIISFVSLKNQYFQQQQSSSISKNKVINIDNQLVPVQEKKPLVLADFSTVINQCAAVAPLVLLMVESNDPAIEQYNLKNISLFYKNQLPIVWPAYFEALALDKTFDSIPIKRYWQSIAGSVTVNASNVLSVATLWHLSGNTGKAKILLKQFIPSFSLAFAEHSYLNGRYRFSGFNSKGLLRFSGDGARVGFTYDAFKAMSVNHSLDEWLPAWEIIESPQKRYQHFIFTKARKSDTGINISLTANRNTFYYGRRDIHMPNNRLPVENALVEISVTPMKSNPVGLPQKLGARASLDSVKGLMLVGSPRASLPVALKPYHFPQALKSLETEFIIDQFFDLGYLDVAGRLIKAPYKYSTMQFQRDFDGLSPKGAERIMKGLNKSWLGDSVGKVFVTQLVPNEMKFKTEILGEGAADRQFYGSAVGLSGSSAMVCDGVDQIFIYRFEQKWRLKQILRNHPCSNMKVFERSALIINGSNSIYELTLNNGYWHKGKDITIKDKPEQLKNGESFDWFGNSLSLVGNTAIVANTPNYRQGAVYVFEKPQSSWLQTQRISSEQFSIGQAVYLQGGNIWITGADIREGVHQKFVLVYEKITQSWQHTHTYKLEPTVSSDWNSRPPALAVGADGGMHVFSAQWFKLPMLINE